MEDEINRLSTDKKSSETMMRETAGNVVNAKAQLTKITAEATLLSDKSDKLTTEFTSKEEQISELKHKKVTLDADIGNVELKNRELTSQIAIKVSELGNVSTELAKAEEEYDAKVKSIEDEINQTKSNLSIRENQSKILKILLDEEYIKDNIYNVMKTVNQSGVDSLEKLQRASAVSMPEVNEALKALNAKGVIELYATGNYKVLKDLNV